MSLEETILDLIKANLNTQSEVNISSELNHDNGISSFDKLMIINSIEDHFSITFQESEMVAIKSVSDIVEMVKILITKKENLTK